jgi:hypothetical protein
MRLNVHWFLCDSGCCRGRCFQDGDKHYEENNCDEYEASNGRIHREASDFGEDSPPSSVRVFRSIGPQSNECRIFKELSSIPTAMPFDTARHLYEETENS